jgi:hypothetical protein
MNGKAFNNKRLIVVSLKEENHQNGAGFYVRGGKNRILSRD